MTDAAHKLSDGGENISTNALHPSIQPSPVQSSPIQDPHQKHTQKKEWTVGSLICPARLDRSHFFQTHENPAPSTPTAYRTPTQIILPFGAVSGPFPFPKPKPPGPPLSSPPLSLSTYTLRCPSSYSTLLCFLPYSPPNLPLLARLNQLLHVTALASSLILLVSHGKSQDRN